VRGSLPPESDVPTSIEAVEREEPRRR